MVQFTWENELVLESRNAIPNVWAPPQTGPTTPPTIDIHIHMGIIYSALQPHTDAGSCRAEEKVGHLTQDPCAHDPAWRAFLRLKKRGCPPGALPAPEPRTKIQRTTEILPGVRRAIVRSGSWGSHHAGDTEVLSEWPWQGLKSHDC